MAGGSNGGWSTFSAHSYVPGGDGGSGDGGTYRSPGGVRGSDGAGLDAAGAPARPPVELHAAVTSAATATTVTPR